MVLDIFSAFWVCGYAVALLTGGTTESGFSLTGFPAIFMLALMAAYFYFSYHSVGGTFWQRVFHAR